MKKIPKISVIIPVYNSEKYLFEALESIRTQSFTDFECIILNDGSIDSSKKIIEDFIITDSRFILIDKENEGVGKTLKLGVELSKADVIARMDSDDISYKYRLEYQYQYLIRKSCSQILGSNVKLKKGKNLKKAKILNNDKLIKWSLLLGISPIYHPTIMMYKKDILDSGNYSNNIAEDFVLWINSFNKVKFKNLRRPLLIYRFHESQISSDFDKKIEVFNQNSLELLKLYKDLKIKMDLELLEFIYFWKDHPKLDNNDKFKIMKSFNELFFEANEILNFNLIDKIKLLMFNFKIYIKVILKSENKIHFKSILFFLDQFKIFIK